MAAPYKTVEKISEVIKKYIPGERLPEFLMDLELTLIDSKNQSFNETIRRILENLKAKRET